MSAWSPSDLTNTSFVATQLSSKDRSTALFSVSNELTSAETRLKQQGLDLEVAQNAANNGPSRGQINALKAISNDSSRSPAEREQAAQQAANLADQRDKLNVAAENALNKFNSTREYVDTLVQGQSNLLSAGAVPPGVNQFASPPGYDGRSSPAQDVPASQNPSATPVEVTEELENASANVNDTPDVNNNAGADENVFNPLEAPPGVEVDEFAGIDQQVADNENALQEPPALSEEEVNAYFDQQREEQIENSEPATIEESVFDPRQEVTESVFDPGAAGGSRGLTAKQLDTNSQATQQDVSNFKQKEDWRVRLSLAPSADYLYKVPKGSAGILEPLQATDGVVFPYTPQIQVNYQANYDPTELTHSNYKIFQYRNSGVDSISITCDFTAQDTYEANYLLAVIHFFRSVTKMFYGQDQNPKPGTPPPLCYLSGLGAFQFDAHPLAITSFNYSLPSDVDYIRAGAVTAGAGVNRSPSNTVNNSQNVSESRLGPGIGVGGTGAGPIFSTPPGTVDPTYVPTKIQLSIGAIPVVTRNDISNKFSLKEYATGSLLRGTRRQGGGIW